ncbi:MAG TPA: alpha/beta fold hydrolase [Terriglobales bacterium]|nr:alpha/beta fold hydrolase [Terriglobales bacterium]
MSPNRFLLPFILLSTLSLCAAPPEKFQLKVGTRISGSEEYEIVATKSGFRLTGKSSLLRPQGRMELSQREDLGIQWELVRYTLSATINNNAAQTADQMQQVQTIEAWADKGQVQMRVGMNMQFQSAKTELKPHTVVLDNLVAAHFQVLLDSLGPTPPASATLWLVVPQTLTALPGSFSTEKDEDGTLDGKPVHLHKYMLVAGGVTEILWAEAGGNRLMRVSVPGQQVEITRGGFAPAAVAAPAAPMVPPGPAAFTERDLTFPSAGLQFPATLCLPDKLSGRVPLLVLVQGSGPHDRDETIGANKPFRDLAHGLAAQGIATLRYDKRTFAFPASIDAKNVTVKEEVIDDAVAALSFARTLPEVDPVLTFVLGHSLGGSLAPFIAERVPEIRGQILMAAAARPLDELIFEQISRQMKLAGKSDEEIQKELGDLRIAFARVRSGEAPNDEIVFHAPAIYWRDLFFHDPRQALAATTAPVLILQGGKDVQVGKADYDLLVQAVAALPAAQRDSHFFPGLNHLFMPVEGESTGQEYNQSGQVAPEVIQTIARFVKAHSAPAPAPAPAPTK